MSDKKVNIVVEHFGHLLSERGGISSDVEDGAWKICDIIIAKIREDGWSKETAEIGKKYISFDSDIHKSKWHIECIVFNFPTVGIYWSEKDKYIYSSVVNYSEKAIKLYIPVINSNGIVPNTLFDTVFHEVLHVYQFIKGACTTGNELYAIARILFGSKNLTENMVGIALYYSFPFEQDAIVHGAYSELIKFYGLHYQKAFPQTIAYIAYNSFDEAIKYVKSHPNEVKLILKNKFRESDLYTYNWLLKRSRNMFKRFEKKIVIMLEKFETNTKDFEGTHFEPQIPISENNRKIKLLKI